MNRCRSPGRRPQAQHIAQGFFHGDEALLDRLALPLIDFIARGGDVPLREDRQHLLLKTPIGTVEDVQRQLTGIEGKVVCQHLEMNLRVFVPLKARNRTLSWRLASSNASAPRLAQSADWIIAICFPMARFS